MKGKNGIAGVHAGKVNPYPDSWSGPGIYFFRASAILADTLHGYEGAACDGHEHRILP